MTAAEGVTAIQLLETFLSVQVDEEGRISLRDSGFEGDMDSLF